jgi:hypothetical protein
LPILADDDCAERVWSVNGAVNLLSDGLGEMRPPVPADATDEFTRGRMQPDLNGTREAFEREDYAQGSTAELAGHGLYGDYALFIPRSVISLDGSARDQVLGRRGAVEAPDELGPRFGPVKDAVCAPPARRFDGRCRRAACSLTRSPVSEELRDEATARRKPASGWGVKSSRSTLPHR